MGYVTDVHLENIRDKLDKAHRLGVESIAMQLYRDNPLSVEGVEINWLNLGETRRLAFRRYAREMLGEHSM
jgi:hypothetical protein